MAFPVFRGGSLAEIGLDRTGGRCNPAFPDCRQDRTLDLSFNSVGSVAFVPAGLASSGESKIVSCLNGNRPMRHSLTGAEGNDGADTQLKGRQNASFILCCPVVSKFSGLSQAW